MAEKQPFLKKQSTASEAALLHHQKPPSPEQRRQLNQDLQFNFEQGKLLRVNTITPGEDCNIVESGNGSGAPIRIKLFDVRNVNGTDNMSKYQSVELGRTTQFKDLNRLPLQKLTAVNTGEMIPKIIESDSKVGGEIVRTTQEVQTSFMPSVRDTNEFKHFGESIVNLSIDKDAVVGIITMDKMEQADYNVICEGIDISEMTIKSTMHFLAVETNQSQMQQVSNNDEGKKASIMSRQVYSGPTSARKPPSITQPALIGQPSNQNQMLHQIYIQVNTSGEVHAPENALDEHTFSADSIPGLSYPMRPRHHSKELPASPTQNSVLVKRSGSKRKRDASTGKKVIMAIKGRRVSTEMFGSQQVQSTIQTGKANHSLLVQPIVLGIRSTSRKKSKDKVIQPSSAITKVKNEKQDTGTQQNSSLQAIKVVGYGAENHKTQQLQFKNDNQTQEPKAPEQDKVKQDSKAEKLHLLIGPQVIQWLSPEQAAGAQASGLQIVQTKDENQKFFQGRPIVIDSSTKLGQCLLEETKKRKQIKSYEKDHNKRQVKEQKLRGDMLEYFGRSLTDNKLPQPAVAKFLDQKITVKLEKKHQLHKMETYRERAWKLHHEDQKIAKNQISIQSIPYKQQQQQPDQNEKNDDLILRASVDPIAEQLKPWSQANLLLMEDGTERPQSVDSFDQWNNECDRPTVCPRAASAQPTVIKTNDKKVDELSKEAIAMEIMLSTDYARQLGETDPASLGSTRHGKSEKSQQNYTIYKPLNQTDILMSPQLQNTTLSSDHHAQNFNPNAIVIDSNALNQIAPILQKSGSLSRRHASSKPASLGNTSPMLASTKSDPKDINEQNEALEGDEGTQKFGQRIKSMYLPCTLRKLYYQELKLRKPLFVGASKKGVGFEKPVSPNQGTNARTCMALQNQQLLAQQARVLSENGKPTSPGLQNDETFLQVSSAKLSHKQGAHRMAMNRATLNTPPCHRRACCRRKMDVSPTQVTALQDIVNLNPKAIFDLPNEAGDRFLTDVSANTKNIAAGDMTQGEVSDARKSKVIFSVKKNQSQSKIDNKSSKAAKKLEVTSPVTELMTPNDPVSKCTNQQTSPKQLLETDRSPDPKLAIADDELKAQEFNVTTIGQIKILVSKDGPANSQTSKLSLQNTGAVRQSFSKVNVESADYVRSYTCADLANAELMPGVRSRRVRSAKYSYPVISKKDFVQAVKIQSKEEISSGAQRSAPNERATRTPGDKASVNIIVNSTNSNLGRINLERIQQQQQTIIQPQQPQSQQHVNTSHTETENQNRQHANHHQAKWNENVAGSDSAAEIGSPRPAGLFSLNNQFKKVRIVKKQALSPNIVNICLGKAASTYNLGENNKKEISLIAPLKSSQLIKNAILKSNSAEGDKAEKAEQVKELNFEGLKQQRNCLHTLQLPADTKVSQGSFYISEDDSQHTLTPVAHSQNLHRHAAYLGPEKVPYTFKAPNRLKASKFLRAQHSRAQNANLHQIKVTGVAPPCTCNLLTEKQDSNGSNQVDSMRGATGKNRVVFVMKGKDEANNDDERNKDLRARAISQESQTNNNDLAHLPIYKEGQCDDSLEQEEAMVDASIAPCSFGGAEPPELDSPQDNMLMKSDKSNHLSIISPSKIERLVARSSFSSDRHAENRSQTQMNEQAADASTIPNEPHLSAQSPHRWGVQHNILPAVNSDSKFTPAQHLDHRLIEQRATGCSYADIVNLQNGSKQENDTKITKYHILERQRNHAHSTARISNLQVKMHLAKNPNQCPPRLSALGGQRRSTRRKSSKPSVQQILQQCSSKGFKSRKPSGLDQPISPNNKVISVTVRSESEKRSADEEDGDNDREVLHQIVNGQLLQYPGFNTLAPVQLVSAEDLTSLSLNVSEPPFAKQHQFNGRVGSNHVVVADYATTMPELHHKYAGASGHVMDKLPSQPALNGNQLVGSAGNSLRVKSQRSIGNLRMNRLQRLYQTQRGRNIMSLVSSKNNKKEPVTQASPSIQMIGKMATLASLNDHRTTNSFSQQQKSRHLMKQRALTGPTLDVGQSIQRFSIHVSPKNQTVTFRGDGNDEKSSECQYHKALRRKSQENQTSEQISKDQGNTQIPRTLFTTTFNNVKSVNHSDLPQAVRLNSAQQSPPRMKGIEHQMPSPGKQNLIDFASNSAVSSVGRHRKQHSQIRRGSIARNFSRPMTSVRNRNRSLGNTGDEDLTLKKETSGAMQSVQNRIVKGLAVRHFTANLKARGIQIDETPADILLQRRKTSAAAESTTIAQTIQSTLHNSGNGEARKATIKKTFDRKRSAPKRQIQAKKAASSNLNIEDYKFDRAQTGSLIAFTSENGIKTTAVLRKHGRMFSPDLNYLLQQNH